MAHTIQTNKHTYVYKKARALLTNMLPYALWTCYSTLSIYLSVCYSICLSLCLLLCLSICLSATLSVCYFVCLSLCLLLYLSATLSVTPPISRSTTTTLILYHPTAVPYCLSLKTCHGANILSAGHESLSRRRSNDNYAK